MHPFERIQDYYKRGHRQQHECSCGPSSLALAANALGFKEVSESHFISEELARWMPIHQFLTRGMALHEAQFVAEAVLTGKIEVSLRRAFPENHAVWAQDLAAIARSNDSVIVINFLQDHLIKSSWEGPGNPHYSVIAGVQNQNVQIADVDTEIHDLYSRSIDQVFESMMHINPAFQLPRGWLLLRVRS